MRFEDYIYKEFVDEWERSAKRDEVINVRHAARRTRLERQAKRRRMAVRLVICLMVVIVVACMIGIHTASEGPAEEPPMIAEPMPKAEPVPAESEQEAIDPLEAEKIAIAQTVWGEARGCTVEGQENVVWTILARYDDGRFGDSILEVITAKNQFFGYDAGHPVDPEIMEITERIVRRWLDGDPGPGYLYFTGDGVENHFRTEA